MSRRTERVSELLREALGALLTEGVKDPRVGQLVTVQRVDLSADLQHATVRVTVLGDDARHREAIAGLTAATPYLRRQLGQRLSLKHTPELRFAFDESIEEGDRVLSLLDALKEQETPPNG